MIGDPPSPPSQSLPSIPAAPLMSLGARTLCCPTMTLPTNYPRPGGHSRPKVPFTLRTSPGGLFAHGNLFPHGRHLPGAPLNQKPSRRTSSTFRPIALPSTRPPFPRNLFSKQNIYLFPPSRKGRLLASADWTAYKVIFFWQKKDFLSRHHPRAQVARFFLEQAQVPPNPLKKFSLKD